MKPALLAALLLAIAVQDSDEAWHPWIGFKKGTVLKTRQVAKYSGKTQSMNLTTKLEKVGDKGYTIQVSITGLGKPRTEKRVESVSRKKQKTRVKVDGTNYECRLVESKLRGRSTPTRLWFNPEKGVPLKYKDAELDVTAKAFEKTEAGGESYDCVRLDGTILVQGRKAKANVWWSKDVPGGFVRVKFRANIGGTVFDSVTELVEFEAK